VKAQHIFNVQIGNKTAFYHNLEEAIGEAASGDTIYLPGALIEVQNDLVIDKKLAIIGVGADSIGQGHQVTRIVRPGWSFNVHFTSGSSGSLIMGCLLESITVGGDNSDTVQNIMIYRNKSGSIHLGNNNLNGDDVKRIFIKENIIKDGAIMGQGVKECVIQNNLIYNVFSIGGFQSSLIQNNIVRVMEALQSCIIENNFITSSGLGSGCNYNTVNNNAFIGEPGVDNNIYHDNLINQSVENTFKNGLTSSSKDVELLPGSPCKNAGTDGTDIGIYGGSSPFKKGSVPINPHIGKVIISNVTDSEGKIKVDMKVSAQER
jgi:hypothetical protein